MVVGIFYIPTKMGEQKYLDIQSHHQLSPESFGEWFFKAYFAGGPNAYLPGGLVFGFTAKTNPRSKGPTRGFVPKWHRYLLEVPQQTGLHFSWPFKKGGQTSIASWERVTISHRMGSSENHRLPQKCQLTVGDMLMWSFSAGYTSPSQLTSQMAK